MMTELRYDHTPDRLVLDYVPWGTGVLLVGLTVLFAAFGLYGVLGDRVSPLWWFAGAGACVFAAALFVTRERLVLDAAQDRIEYRMRSVFGTTERQGNLSGIRDVQLVEYSKSSRNRGDQGGRGKMRQITILLSDGAATIPDAMVGGPTVPAAHSAIQAWLDRHRTA